MTGKRWAIASAILYAQLHLTTAAATTISIGSDYFSWREYNPDGSELLEESGMRYFLSFDGMTNPDADWRFGIGAKIYAAEVEYDGQDQNGIPAVSSTDYVGFNGEMRLHRAISGSRYLNRPRWYFVMAGGGDSWQRDIHSVSGGALGYVEEYTLIYGRLGLRREVKESNGLTVSFGLKMPLYIDERVLLYDGVTLNPKGMLSGYLSIGVKLLDNVTVRATYDSYRFDPSEKSDPITNNGAYVDNNNNGVPDRYYQPESAQDTIGISFEVKL